jgi:hypothetical protein
MVIKSTFKSIKDRDFILSLIGLSNIETIYLYKYRCHIKGYSKVYIFLFVIEVREDYVLRKIYKTNKELNKFNLLITDSREGKFTINKAKEEFDYLIDKYPLFIL